MTHDQIRQCQDAGNVAYDAALESGASVTRCSDAYYAAYKAMERTINQNAMEVVIMWRSNYDGGDGWSYGPRKITISRYCPICGAERGKPYPYHFCEDGEWFTVDRWNNPCGHIDLYGDCWREAKNMPRPGYIPHAVNTLDDIVPIADAMMQEYAETWHENVKDWKDIKGDCAL